MIDKCNNNVYITLFLIITYNNCRIAICHEVKQSQTWDCI